MLCFNIVLSIFFSFFMHSSVIAMNYYLSDDIKKAILFREGLKYQNNLPALPQDVKNVIGLKSYYLYCHLLLAYDDQKVKNFEFVVNNQERLKEFYGEEIHLDSPIVLMMNDEGRNFFLNLKNHIAQYRKPDGFVHPFSGRIEISKKELSVYSRECYVTRKDYNKILKLPLRLRSAIGDLCVIPVFQKHQISFPLVSCLHHETGLFDIEQMPLVPENFAAALRNKYIM